ISTVDYHVYDNDTSDYVTLDWDDRDATGRETMTISKVRSGVYSYSVHNHEHRGYDIDDTESTYFKKSRARVKVLYCAAAPCETSSPTFYRKKFHVPNDNGTLWRVFTFDKDASGPFTRVKTLSIQSDETSVF
ncbi:MAG: hypothetical protein MK481_11305, partial [SAR324 cluster bacterium]|nr:hypothetical protein [SAR324 cluster bacterium]